jgi:hypothetical protein
MRSDLETVRWYESQVGRLAQTPEDSALTPTEINQYYEVVAQANTRVVRALQMRDAWINAEAQKRTAMNRLHEIVGGRVCEANPQREEQPDPTGDVPPPTDVRVSGRAGSFRVQWEWDLPEGYFTLYRAECGAESFELIGLTTGRSFEDHDAEPGTNPLYRVVAHLGKNRSTPSTPRTRVAAVRKKAA